jgi:imidazolonepropionase-like amidohydrolase
VRTLIYASSIVMGDGSPPVVGGTLVVEHGRIAGVEPGQIRAAPGDAQIVDATGCVAMPGLINCHAHGVAPGPLFPSAAPAPDEHEWRANLDRHLLAGTTTVLSLCGFVTMHQIGEADRSHPVNVRGATSHTPSSLRAARAADGRGLSPETEQLTVEAMLEAGAVAIGELGAGQTLGGGGQDASYIPAAIAHATGVRISPAQARRLKEAALGRYICERAFDPAIMTVALEDAGLARRLPPRAAFDIVVRCVMPSFEPAIASIAEGAELSAALGVPALIHSAAASARAMRDVARHWQQRGASLIACHSNHPTFTPNEAHDLARELVREGCIIEACTFDLIDARQLVDTRDQWDRLLADSGLVDILATDYGLHGRHDPLIAGIADIVDRGYASLPDAIAMATSRVADSVPGIAPGRGRLAKDTFADIAIARQEDLRNVRHVFSGGRHVVRDGQLVV